MPTLSLSPIRFTQVEVAELVDLYASNPQYCRAAGEYDPDHVPADRVEADLREEAATEGHQVLIARDDSGRSVGLLCLLERHPGDGQSWIGLLLVHGDQHRQGIGRLLAKLAEKRFRGQGRDGVRLAVLENNSAAFAFWSALGWQEIDRRTDQHGRPCIVMDKRLA